MLMNYKKKERLYISDIIDDPPITYPMYYIISGALKENEMLLSTLEAIHLCNYDMFEIPLDASALYSSLNAGSFPIYKEQYLVGNFGGRLMYLESSGWKSLNVTENIFDMNNWLI